MLYMFLSFLGGVAETPFLTFWNAEGGSCKGLVLTSHRLFLLLQVLSFEAGGMYHSDS